MSISGGLFTVELDFGAQFAGQERFLEIDVRQDAGLDCGSPAGFVTLAPRQRLTAAPNALFSLNAEQLDGLDSTATATRIWPTWRSCWRTTAWPARNLRQRHRFSTGAWSSARPGHVLSTHGVVR